MDIPLLTLNYQSTLRFKNQAVTDFVEAAEKLFEPTAIHWCDGSEAEKQVLWKLLVDEKALTPLNPKTYPGCYWTRSNPNDVARVEKLTVICTKNPADVGPTNRHRDPVEMKQVLTELSRGAMRGRTMYVLAYCMGPLASPYSEVGVMVTDSAYVLMNMQIMTHMGQAVMDKLSASKNPADFVKGLHSLLDCNPERRWIAHFPEEDLIWSVGSGYGGNALLGKKCHALRIGSYRARKNGWLAEHMMIIKVKRPDGKIFYGTGAFPSACGKTNMAMLVPPTIYKEAGWQITTIGDDIAWLHVGPDGRLHAINPENGFFGVAPGTNMHSNPNFMTAARRGTLFTNTAYRPDTNEPWWEGIDVHPNGRGTARRAPTVDLTDLIDWQGHPYVPEYNENGKTKNPAAHPNSRATVPVHNCPSIDPQWDSPAGVPISFILFGGRRASGAPLIVEARNWPEGVWLGATMSSETTAAAEGQVGALRFDPMAMLPFCGYDMGEYFQHWLNIGERLGKSAPKIFRIDAFRLRNGEFLWPGFGDNIRLIEWVCARCAGEIAAHDTALGLMPHPKDIHTEQLQLLPQAMEEILTLDTASLKSEIVQVEAHLAQFATTLPPALKRVTDSIKLKL